MPRKLKRVPPVATSATQAAQAPEPIPTPLGEPPPRPKVGRPSKADLEAREAALRAANQMKPADTVYLTATCLKIVSWTVKGDEPTDEEITAVNEPACAVLNKYPGSLRWAPEVALLSALFSVTMNMRHRGKEKRKSEAASGGDDGETRRAPHPGSEGFREVDAGTFLPPAP